MSRIAVVIPTHNRQDLLRVCLKSVFEQSLSPELVLVVDNGSTDGTREMVNAEFPQAQYLFIPEPCGSAGGFAAGVRFAMDQGYEWVWLMDNDAYPAPDALDVLVRAAQSMSGKVFNSLVVTPDGGSVNWGYHYYLGDDYHTGRRLYSTVRELLTLNQPVLNGLAQFYPGALIHREVIEKVGVPTPEFFTRGDEVDYVLRIQEAGFKTYTVVTSRVTHPPEPYYTTCALGRTVQVPTLAPWKQYYALRNHIINSRRHGWDRAGWLGQALRLSVSYAFRSLVLPDHKLRRLWYTYLGLTDGILGRLYVNRTLH
jgi:rhamnopyranosyl-N-acetylglucosaminyl-diphospho-decaprenol beta-1,3/1,4-galactofuranosyltransferase